MKKISVILSVAVLMLGLVACDSNTTDIDIQSVPTLSDRYYQLRLEHEIFNDCLKPLPLNLMITKKQSYVQLLNYYTENYDGQAGAFDAEHPYLGASISAVNYSFTMQCLRKIDNADNDDIYEPHHYYAVYELVEGGLGYVFFQRTSDGYFTSGVYFARKDDNKDFSSLVINQSTFGDLCRIEPAYKEALGRIVKNKENNGKADKYYVCSIFDKGEYFDLYFLTESSLNSASYTLDENWVLSKITPSNVIYPQEMESALEYINKEDLPK